MREEYDFSKGTRNPYAKSEKTSITIRLDKSTVDYFKGLSDEANMPYQTLINAYLADCAHRGLKPTLTWS